MLSRLAQGLLRSAESSCSQHSARALSGLAFQKVERVSWDNKGDAEQQQKDIMGRSEPLIITGSIESWPVRKYNLDSMRKEFGDIVVSTCGASPLSWKPLEEACCPTVKTSISAMQKQCISNTRSTAQIRLTVDLTWKYS